MHKPQLPSDSECNADPSNFYVVTRELVTANSKLSNSTIERTGFGNSEFQQWTVLMAWFYLLYSADVGVRVSRLIQETA